MYLKSSILNLYQDRKLILVLIFTISILSCLAFLLFFKNIGPVEHGMPGSDYLSYYRRVAESISQGKGIPIKEYFATAYPIGYPLILSGLFSISNLLNIDRLELIIVFNVFATAFAACFLFLFVESIFKKKIALMASFLWLTYPFNLWLIKNPNTEVPFILIFYLALWLYVLAIKKHSSKLFLVVGILIGFMSLIRPTSIFLPIPLIFLIFFLIKNCPFRKKLLFSLILLISYIVIILPWIIYIYLNIGKIVLLSTVVGHYWVASASITFIVDVPKMRGEAVLLPNDVINLINDFKGENIRSSLNIASFFLEELISRPITVFKLMIIKMARSWYATSEMWWEKEILSIQLLYLISAISGIILWLERKKEMLIHLIFPLVIVFYFWVITTTVLSILRYMIPVMGIVMIFSSISFLYLGERLIKFKRNLNKT